MNTTKAIAYGLLGLVIFIAAMFGLGAGRGNWEERRFSCAPEGVDEIFVSAKNIRVVVEPGSGSEIEVTYHVSDRVVFSESFAQGRMSLVQENVPGRWFGWDWGLNKRPELTVRIPAGWEAAGDFRTTNGSLNAEGLNFTQLRLTSSNGSIKARSLTVTGEIKLKTSNSSIALEAAKCGSADLDTSNSSIKVHNVITDEITAKTSNSSIAFDRVTCARANLTTSNSSIRTSLTGTPDDYSVTVHTSNSSIHVGGAKVGNGTHGSGGKAIRLRTSNGSIRVDFTP